MQPVNHNRQKKIAVINDYSGFGRCSVAVAMPIISTMKVQCCPVPTAILSNHTGFEEFFFDDYTDNIQEYVDNWKKLGLKFEGISTGFLGSEKQIAIVRQFIREFRSGRTTVIVDPVMGDYGKKYSTYTDGMCQAMKQLVHDADILTPNLTEACILTDTEYHDGAWKIVELKALARRLSDMGPQKVVITGIRQKDFVANLVYQRGKQTRILRTHRVGTERSGTGDVFAAIIAADAVNSVPFDVSVKKASNFVKRCILRSEELGIPKTDGVCFEEILSTLK